MDVSSPTIIRRRVRIAKSTSVTSIKENQSPVSTDRTVWGTPPPCCNSAMKGRPPFSAVRMDRDGHLPPFVGDEYYEPMSELSCRSRLSFHPSLDSVPEIIPSPVDNNNNDDDDDEDDDNNNDDSNNIIRNLGMVLSSEDITNDNEAQQ
jgi:hypothetical protein